jgi:type II secretory pathway pseudopilin PulG
VKGWPERPLALEKTVFATPLARKYPRAFESGFTLLDALFAIAILAILLALVVPQYDAVLKQAKATEVTQGFAHMRRELELHRVAHQSYGDGSASTNVCGVDPPEGRYFKFQCVTGHQRGPDLEYQITAVAKGVLAAAPETKVSTALFSVNQDGVRNMRVVMRSAKELVLACLPIMGAAC